MERLTAIWQLSCLPTCPQYWRVTPTECPMRCAAWRCFRGGNLLRVTYAAALDLARARSYKNGRPGSAELFRLLLEDPSAYKDYLQLRDRIRDGSAGEPPSWILIADLQRLSPG